MILYFSFKNKILFVVETRRIYSNISFDFFFQI